MDLLNRFVGDGIRAARRLVVGVVGATVLIGGLALLVLPGPAFLVIPIGLGILAIEFEWARRWLRRARDLYGAPPQSVTEGHPSEDVDIDADIDTHRDPGPPPR